MPREIKISKSNVGSSLNSRRNDIAVGNPVLEQSGTFNLAASGIGTTSYSANTLSTDFDNSAGFTDQTTQYQLPGYPAPGVKTLYNNTPENFTLKTKLAVRDQEITTNAGKGTLFLRLTNDGRAICLGYDITTNRIMIRIVNSVDDTASPLCWNMSGGILYDSSTAATPVSIPGFSTATYLDSITFGAVGVDVYFKFNGIEYFRFKCRYHTLPGKCAIKVYQYPISSFTAKHFSRTTLYSNTDANIIDARDFGMKYGNTTGSITAGQNTLAVAALNGLQVGDAIIVELGGEASLNGYTGGERGTVGVGGQWPSLSYANLAAMQADNSKGAEIRAWCRDTSLVYYYHSGVWTRTSTIIDNGGYNEESEYYQSLIVPKALRARITNINGLVLTLDKSAVVTTTAANVYFDNTFILTKLLCFPQFDFFGAYDYPNGQYDMSNAEITQTINMPGGNYAVGERIIFSRINITWQGSGIDVTNLFSPKGTSSFNIDAINAHNTTVQNFTCTGNGRLNGYGMQWEVSYASLVNQIQPEDSEFHYPQGFQYVGSNNYVFQNMKAVDILESFGGGQGYSSFMYRQNVTVVRTVPLMHYLQWHFQDADSTDGTWDTCIFDSDYIHKTFEAFKCLRIKFINCSTRNGLVSSNTSDGVEFTNLTQIINANSKPSSIHPFEPLININNNAGNTTPGNIAAGNVKIQNTIQRIQGYIDDHSDIFRGINITAECSNVLIQTWEYTAPNFVDGAITGPHALSSDGTSITLDGLVCTGDQRNGLSFNKANVSMHSGIIKNTTAKDVYIHAGVDTSVGNTIANLQTV